MNYTEGMNVSDFILVSIRKVPSIQSTAYILSHEKTGARLLKLANSDDNKVFSIVFRTPPDDDSGLPHILEHSVLTGSRKYPTKEPFVELLKSSLNTFLNAMTFPDKTMYPVASKNEKDFLNLMDVYLDAVFFPNIYANPYTLMQEGWHYEFDQASRLIISGVVYNEMKGAFSSPERILFSKIQKLLYPDTYYAFESGGEPEAIPTLTHEKFLDFHRTYYHPSNSFIYLYGDGNLERELALIEGYVEQFSKKEINIVFPHPAPFPRPVSASFEYPISQNEDSKERSFLAFAAASGSAADPIVYLGYEIVRHLLLGNSASPLKKALLKAGIGKDIAAYVETEIHQPFMCIIVKNTEPEIKEAFLNTIKTTLENLVKNGIERRMIEASLNHIEFQLREAEHPNIPRGLLYHFMSMASWLYSDDPLVHLDFAPALLKIRNSVNNGFFENFIRERILTNTHAAHVTLIPKPGLAELREETEEKKLSSISENLSEDEKRGIAEKAEELRRRQSEPDSPQALDSLPYLTLADLNPRAEIIPIEIAEIGKSAVLLPDVITNGIVYVNCYFNMNSVNRELLPYTGLLASILGKIRTRKKSYEELAQLINLHTGGIDSYTESFSIQGDISNFTPRLIVRGKALESKLSNLVDIISEILLDSDVTDHERIREIIKETKARYEMSLTERGHLLAMKRLFSYFSPVDLHDDAVSGFSFYKFLSLLEKNLDKNIDETIDALKRTINQAIAGNGLLVTITADGGRRKEARKHLNELIKQLPDADHQPKQTTYTPTALNEALLLGQSQVQYVAKGSNFISKGMPFTGEMHVLATILRLDYLWNRVRVQGGAYGVMVSIMRNGNIAFTSYRDPRLVETVEVYKNAASYLRGFKADSKEMTRYIIGTIATLDKHLTPREKGEKAARMHLSGIIDDVIQQEREHVLSCSTEKISGFAELIKEVMNDDFLCVLGNEVTLRENKNLFRNLVQVMD